MEKCNVFLGGTCAETTWRDELIKYLDDFNITYFNPVVEDWTEACQVIEEWHKKNDDYNLFVITKEMTGVFSIAEVVDLSNKRPESTIFCVLRDGFSKAQLKSLDATIKMVKNNGAIVADSLKEIADILNEKVNDEPEDIFYKQRQNVIEYRPDCDPKFAELPGSNIVSVFLAGTIDMGNSENWQSKILDSINTQNILCKVYNPRRDSWPGNNSEEFEYQVNWEQNNLEGCDIIFMYITGTSKSPITLLELGEFINSHKLMVVCEEDFYRYGNVKIMCERFNVPLYNSYDEGVIRLLNTINNLHEIKKIGN